MNITVYLGANEGNAPFLKEAVRELGAWIGTNRNTLVYGGSKSGLMGELAESVLQAGGKVIGVEPQFFIDAGTDHYKRYVRKKGKDDRTWRCVHCISGRNGNTGRDHGGDVQGIAKAFGCTVYSI